jgi:hypothetical protein
MLFIGLSRKLRQSVDQALWFRIVSHKKLKQMLRRVVQRADFRFRPVQDVVYCVQANGKPD